MSTRRLATLALGSALLALFTSACATSTCSRTADSSTVGLASVDGVAQTDADGGALASGDTGVKVGSMYYSAPYGGPYAYFPAFRTITFEHDLGVVPFMQFFLAFTSDGTLAQSAGNLTELPKSQDGGPPAVTDQTIKVFNNTCSELYLWVEAQGTAPAPAP